MNWTLSQVVGPDVTADFVSTAVPGPMATGCGSGNECGPPPQAAVLPRVKEAFKRMSFGAFDLDFTVIPEATPLCTVTASAVASWSMTGGPVCTAAKSVQRRGLSLPSPLSTMVLLSPWLGPQLARSFEASGLGAEPVTQAGNVQFANKYGRRLSAAAA